MSPSENHIKCMNIFLLKYPEMERDSWSSYGTIQTDGSTSNRLCTQPLEALFPAHPQSSWISQASLPRCSSLSYGKRMLISFIHAWGLHQLCLSDICYLFQNRNDVQYSLLNTSPALHHRLGVL